jgi:hypothetical protein
MQLGLALLTASFLMLPATNVLAGEIDYTIITSESSLTLTVLDTTTVASSAQSSSTTGNTATASVSGTLGATIGGGSISFGGDTAIDANQQLSTAVGHPLLNLRPSTTGGGSAPADIGLNLSFKVTSLLTITASGQSSINNLVSNVGGGGALSGGSSGNFLASTTTLGISNGIVDYSLSAVITSLSGSASIGSGSNPNNSTADGTVTVNGLTTTITLPVSSLITGLITTLGAELNVRIVGTIVAQYIATVPEPGSLTLMGIASLGGLGWMGWARRRRASK